MDSETFGVEKGRGREVVDWINSCARKERLKLEARLYGHDMTTQNFGTFEMFSWVGDPKAARRLTVRASKRFRVRVIEGAYKTRDSIFHTKRSDYAMVRRGERVIGHLQLEMPRVGRGEWQAVKEERR